MTWYNIPTIPSSLQGQSSIVTFGDSITDAVAATINYTTRLGLMFAVSTSKRGVSSTPLQNSNRVSEGTPTPNNGRDRYSADMTGGNKRDIAVIMYGTNDIGFNGETNWTVANFENDLDEIVKGLIAAGYAADEIILCTPPWIEDYNFNATFSGADTAKHLTYNTAVRDVAAANNTLFADCYTALLDNTDAISSDGLHPNDEGHKLMASAIAGAGLVS